MRAEAPELAAANAPANHAATWWRDPSLWTAVALTVALKLVVLWLLMSLRRKGFVQQVQADLGAWSEFIKAVRAGARPYIDAASDVPVLATSYYWLLAKLSAVLQPHSPRPVLLCSTLLMAAVDAVNCGLFYRLVHQVSPRSALRATIVWTCSLSALLAGPAHLDPLIITCLLLAYRFHTLGQYRALAATLSVAAGLTPFAIWLLAAVLIPSRQPRRWLEALAIFAAVQVALHVPFVLAGWPASDALTAFITGLTGPHGDAASFAPDTALGLIRLWIGQFGIHDAAIWLCLATGVFALVRVRTAELPRAIVVLAIATMLFRPQAGSSWQLWLYPFLLLMALRAEAASRSWLLIAAGVLDLANVLANPLVSSPMRRELGVFDPGAALERGSAFTLVFSVSVLVKLTLLTVLLRRLARAPLPLSSPLPAAAENPLTWPSIDISAVRARLSRPSLALWLAGAIVIGHTAVTASVMLPVPEYSDEVFHGEQVERYCRGDTERREGITMLLGYHVITSAIVSWQGDCSRELMRKLNVGWGLAVTLFGFLILQARGAENPAMRTLGFHWLPVLFPYYFFIYTDVLALVLMLLALYLSIRRYWVVAGLVASVSIAVRQTNALMLIIIALLALMDTPRTTAFSAWLKEFLRKSWSSLLGLTGFAIFVVRNHGIAVGDRSSHPMGLHIGNFAFLLFLLAFAALPVNLERIWRERERLVRTSFGLALSVLFFAYLYLFKVENPYNEHDNFLRNVVVLWATKNLLTKTLFFIPIALGFAALWTTPFMRRSDWVWVPIVILGLLPESLIEQRYAILPLTLWMLTRRDGSPFAESLTAVFNLGVSMWLLQQVASGEWGI
jgi:alpha-1,2-glucosyltransferase